MNSLQNKIHSYLTERREQIKNELMALIKIPSVRGEAEKNAPFGKGCADVLEYSKTLYESNGFKTELDLDGGYMLAYYGEGKKSLGLFAHADVVPVSDDWILTNPFEPIEKDGFIIGRGAMDDKPAIITSLYCAKMIKELDIPFKSRLICFTGANEESGMQDIKNYVSRHTPPDFSLVCDTGFPLYRGNKGRIRYKASAKRPIESITKIEASNAKGAILGKTALTLKYSDELYSYLALQENRRVKVTKFNNEIIIEANGISRHGALPEGSLNAGSLAFGILANCELICESDRAQFKFLADLFSQYYGQSLGIENNDEVFGHLTVTNDVISLENGFITFAITVNFGKSVSTDKLKKDVSTKFAENGFFLDIELERAPHLTELNDPLLSACLDAYKDFTGDKNAVSYVNAGGTYAVFLPRAIEIGPATWKNPPFSLPDGHGLVHQPDEFVSIDSVLEAIEITMLMLLECDKRQENKK